MMILSAWAAFRRLAPPSAQVPALPGLFRNAESPAEPPPGLYLFRVSAPSPGPVTWSTWPSRGRGQQRRVGTTSSTLLPHPAGLASVLHRQLGGSMPKNPDTLNQVFELPKGFWYSRIPSPFLGGSSPRPGRSWLTISPTHLGRSGCRSVIAWPHVIAPTSGSAIRSGRFWRLNNSSSGHTVRWRAFGAGHKGLYDTINNSLHFQSDCPCFDSGVGDHQPLVASAHVMRCPAYCVIAKDYTNAAALYTQPPVHSPSSCMVGLPRSRCESSIIRDYGPRSQQGTMFMARDAEQKKRFISAT